MKRETFPKLDGLLQHWQLLLIASLPGSLLHIWAVLNTPDLAAATTGAGPVPDISRLGMWTAEHGAVTLLTFPLLTLVGLLVYGLFYEQLPVLGTRMPAANGPAAKPLRLAAMTAAARELLSAVSSRGEFRLVPRLAGDAVVAPGAGPNDDREFYDPADREVTQRYRQALVELERAGLIERDGEARRLSAMGWPAARLLTRQELDRIALRARHLAEPEQRLLRLIADCRQRYKVDKVVLRRDGSSISAVYGNGQTVPVPDLCPRDEAFPTDPDAAARFEALVAGIPEGYLAALPERRPGNPFVLRVTDIGLRYLRYADVVYAAAA